MKTYRMNSVQVLAMLIVMMPSLVFAGATLQVKGEADISVWMNREFVGKTVKEDGGLIIRDLAPGKYEFKAAKQGYEPVMKEVAVKESQTIEWRITLQEPVMTEEDAVIRLESSMVRSSSVGTIVMRSLPLNAKVYLDGKPYGVTDRKLLHVPTGRHEVKMVFQGKELSADFDLKKDETSVLLADFKQGKIESQTQIIASELGPEVIKLQTARKRKPAMFPHRMHQEMWGCETCHHGKDEEGNQTPYTAGMKIQHCVTCHNPTSMKNKKLNNLMLASHARCKGCHKRIVEELGGQAGPIGKCRGCHIFEKEK